MSSRLELFFSMGFRPFFLGAGLLATCLMPVWLVSFLAFSESLSDSLTFDWHLHEMLFGYVGAVVTGFLLTAIPNWTGRKPLSGWPLAALFLLWLAGRVVMFFPELGAGRVLDSLFLIAVTGIAGHEIWKGGNRRNIPVAVFVGLYALSNILFHLGRIGFIGSDIAARSGISVLVLLVALIGGRIIPNFSNNWLRAQNRTSEIVSFNGYDKAALLLTIPALLLWIFLPETERAGYGLISAAGLHVIRLVRWCGWSVRQNALLLVLHIAYGWLPVGLILLGVDIVCERLPLGQSAGIHALTAGLLTMMTLAVMTRAILGHSGRPLAAGTIGALLFITAFLAAVLRVAAPFAGGSYQPLLIWSGIFWTISFLIFVLRFGSLALIPGK